MNMQSSKNPNGAIRAEQRTAWVDLVRHYVSSLDFGVLQIVVHGARVVQIERTERIRIQDPVVMAESGS